MMKTSSGHLSHLDTPSYSFYTPTPFPALEQRLFPPRDRQTLQHTSSALLVSVVRMGYVLAVVVPVHTVAALVSHTLVSKDRWMDRGWGRGRFPKRLPSWSVGQTLGVPLVGSLFWAVVYGSPRGMDWREESTVPWASKWLFGRGHEGWCIEAEGVTLPALPTERERTAKTSNGEAKHNGGHELSKQHSKTNDGADFIEQAAKATSLSSFTDDSLSIAPPPAPYSTDTEDIPLDILRGHIDGKQFNVHPVPVAAFWQWKSVASAVSRGKVISVKPGNDLSGIGSGPAMSPHERMVLFFVGGGYHSGHAPQGPLSWTVCRQTSLRVLGVNFRKATSDARAFPAALQDALAAWVYVTKRLGFRPENVILMGDSAGGGLALSLQLYLSALMWSKKGQALGRAKRLVLHSPMTDLTLDTPGFVRNESVDIISPYMCSLARDNYLRHVIHIDGRHNPHLPAQAGESQIDVLAARYAIDPYSAPTSSSKLDAELSRLATELPQTIAELGAFHPLFSQGLDARRHRYLAQSLMLLRPLDAESDETEMLVTTGTAELFYDQIKLFVRNMHELPTGVRVRLVECIDWHHVFAYMNLPGSSIKAQVDDIAKTFMLA
ncbi:hypothetical protein EX895_001477 [Sporisorium graminicola]|uniref:Alpha/beta hydrolase fold-3 domain-containing protein n=1 Tax=Sporisorium graminicola TaxID=280036 RepID=A0A4U7L2Y2_9BASI|nr:hypothetical protein EX895_001477 [Sporisorium graminicola]TKY89692.1 hypothetical protein EX895_001477 [Sporisorium graminicola]